MVVYIAVSRADPSSSTIGACLFPVRPHFGARTERPGLGMMVIVENKRCPDLPDGYYKYT